MLLLFHCVLYCQSKLICQAFYNIIQHICSPALLNIGCDALSCLSEPQTLLLLSYDTSEMDVKAGERDIKCIQMSSDICTDASVAASLCAIYVSLYLCGILFDLNIFLSLSLFLFFCCSVSLALSICTLTLPPLCCPESQPESKQLSPLLDSGRGM